MITSFNKYYDWLSDILKKDPKLESGLVKSSVELLRAQLLLKNVQYNEAEKVLR